MIQPTQTTPLFDEFWKLLPIVMRKAKARAAGSWIRMFDGDPDLFLFDRMKSTIKKLIRTKRFKQGIICGAATWIEERRWDDEIADDELAAEEQNERKTIRIHVHCDDCRSTGVRQWLRHIEPGLYDTPVARCYCDNRENWPAYPSISQAERAKGFVRWLE